MNIYGRETKTDYIEPIVGNDIPPTRCAYWCDGHCRNRIAYYAGEKRPVRERCIYCGESPKEHCPIRWCYGDKGGER